jgi:hypothetical protein
MKPTTFSGGNALDGSLTLLDTRTNKEVKTLQLDDENKAHVREVGTR